MYLQEALKENGKARHKTMPEGCYITNDYDGIEFKNEKGTTTFLVTVKTLLDFDWEPYKEPCKHEPNAADCTMFQCEFVRTTFALEYLSKCKHCGVKLEATGWREINSGNADNKTK